MVQSPLAFDFSKTRAICDAFDDAWAFLQGGSSVLTEPSKSLATRTILAKRIIETADQGLTDVLELRADALAFLGRIRPPTNRNGLRREVASVEHQRCTGSYPVGAARVLVEIGFVVGSRRTRASQERSINTIGDAANFSS
jgi:hypothetical protein